MATQNRRPQPQEQSQSNWLGRVEPVVTLVAQAGLILMLVCLGYIFFGVFKGYLANPSQQMINNMRLVGNLCAVAAVAFATCILLLQLEVREMPIIMGVLGAAFYFGLPLAVGTILRKAGTSSNEATQIINQRFVTAGQFIIGVAVLRLVYTFFVSLPELASRETKKANVGFSEKAKDPSKLKLGKPSVFSRCWQLPYCRESVRKTCPAFIAQKTCWKFGKGCYCDEEMIAKIVRGDTGLGGQRKGGAAFLQSDIASRTGGPRKGTKPPCGKCYIYLEHQNLKHRAVGPFVFPATLALVWVLKDILGVVYTTVGGALNSLFVQFSFQSASGATKGPDPLSKQAEYFIAFIIFVFVLIYVTKFVEFCIYKLKI